MSTKTVVETKKRSTQPGMPSRSLGPQPRAAFPQRAPGGADVEPGLGHDFSQIPLYSPQLVVEPCPLKTSGPRSCPFGGACHICPSRVQTKLIVSQPGDRYEQEADQMAENVMRMAQPAAPVRRWAASHLDTGPGSRGQPLPASLRSFFEPRFGHDFSQVRVLSDSEAAGSAREMAARAYTVGRDIVFGAGQYAPATSEGRRLLAHELAHVVQQSSPVNTAARQLVQRQPLPEVKFDRFQNAGNTDPDNCCGLCPTTLGVGRGGTASNGMEMRFTVTGHRAGIEYDVTRTRRNSLWEQRAGAWTRVESDPMGTNDDHHDTDECLTPVHNRIFVIDTPGYPGTALPQPAGTVWGGLGGGACHADATDVVFRFSFAEWAIARSRSEGIAWTVVSPGPFTFWRSTTWLHRNAAGQWVLDAGRSEVARGSISGATINAAPVP